MNIGCCLQCRTYYHRRQVAEAFAECADYNTCKTHPTPAGQEFYLNKLTEGQFNKALLFQGLLWVG